MRVAGSGKNTYPGIAAFVNSLAGPRTLLTLVKIDHADAMRKLLQHPHNFARGDMSIDVVYHMGSGCLGNQGLQGLPRDRDRKSTRLNSSPSVNTALQI